MPIFGFYTAKEVIAKLQAGAEQTHSQKRGTAGNEIRKEQLDRAMADVQQWRYGLEEWENDRFPDRYTMMQLYQEIELDDEVTNHMSTITKALTGTEFEIGRMKEDGSIEHDTEVAKLFKGKWFRKLIRLILESEMQGFTLVQIDPPEPGATTYKPKDIIRLPRELLWPEIGCIRRHPQVHVDPIDYTHPKYSQRLLELGDETDKGLFNNLALLYIYKKNARAYWSSYQSKFGIPPLIVKTDLSNQTNVSELQDFLQNMRSNTWALVGLDDEVTTIPMNGADAHDTFDKMIERMDGAIAKVMEGQTMTSSDGSSYSQAEVHERTSDTHHIDRLRMIETEINDQLLPIIARDFNMNIQGFVFRYKEIKDVDQIISRAVQLKQAGYTVEKDFLVQLTGYPLEEVQAPAPLQPKSVVKAIEDLYKDF